MSDRRVVFRRCLNHISQNLSRQHFDEMKFMCKDVIPYARMEKIHGGIDLFQALEERGRLTCLLLFQYNLKSVHAQTTSTESGSPLNSLAGQTHSRESQSRGLTPKRVWPARLHAYNVHSGHQLAQEACLTFIIFLDYEVAIGLAGSRLRLGLGLR